jgi:hypothetical protein
LTIGAFASQHPLRAGAFGNHPFDGLAADHNSATTPRAVS